MKEAVCYTCPIAVIVTKHSYCSTLLLCSKVIVEYANDSVSKRVVCIYPAINKGYFNRSCIVEKKIGKYVTVVTCLDLANEEETSRMLISIKSWIELRVMMSLRGRVKL